MSVARFCDEEPWGFGWHVGGDSLRRTAHAIGADGGAWLVAPIDADGVEERLRTLGEPRGVIQLLDRHARDSEAWSARLGVPLHLIPSGRVGPFELLPLVRARFWKEAALWWPEARVLVTADALGTLRYFRAGAEPIGVHPLLRATPPRALIGLAPRHVLVGHGRGLHGPDAAAAVDDAVRHARRRLPRAWAGAAASVLRRG